MVEKVIPARDLAEHALDVAFLFLAALEGEFICHLHKNTAFNGNAS